MSMSTKGASIFLQRRVALIKTKSLERLQRFKDLPCQSLAPACSAQTAISCFICPIRAKEDACVRARCTIKHRSWYTAAAAVQQ